MFARDPWAHSPGWRIGPLSGNSQGKAFAVLVQAAYAARGRRHVDPSSSPHPDDPTPCHDSRCAEIIVFLRLAVRRRASCRGLTRELGSAWLARSGGDTDTAPDSSTGHRASDSRATTRSSGPTCGSSTSTRPRGSTGGAASRGPCDARSSRTATASRSSSSASTTTGDPVAGVRFHGPLDGSYQAAIVEEMADSPEIGEIRRLINTEIRLGAIEVKGAWSKGAATPGIRLVAALSRSVTHAMNWLGAEFAIAAVSDTLIRIGIRRGRGSSASAWVPFPDERYRTVAVTWRRARSMELASPGPPAGTPPRGRAALAGPAAARGRDPVEGDSARTRSIRPLVLDVASRSQREVLQGPARGAVAHQLIDRSHEQREPARAR